jgi:hypothetical protein
MSENQGGGPSGKNVAEAARVGSGAGSRYDAAAGIFGSDRLVRGGD